MFKKKKKAIVIWEETMCLVANYHSVCVCHGSAEVHNAHTLLLEDC